MAINEDGSSPQIPGPGTDLFRVPTGPAPRKRGQFTQDDIEPTGGYRTAELDGAGLPKIPLSAMTGIPKPVRVAMGSDEPDDPALHGPIKTFYNLTLGPVIEQALDAYRRGDMGAHQVDEMLRGTEEAVNEFTRSGFDARHIPILSQFADATSQAIQRQWDEGNYLGIGATFAGTIASFMHDFGFGSVMEHLKPLAGVAAAAVVPRSRKLAKIAEAAEAARPKLVLGAGEAAAQDVRATAERMESNPIIQPETKISTPGDDGPLVVSAGDLAAEQLKKANRKAIRTFKPTVGDPQRVEYPLIYQNPREMLIPVAEAARQTEESPLLKQLFGVTREDLYNINDGTRQGNLHLTDNDPPFQIANKPKGAKVADQITTPRNTQRITDILAEAQRYPEIWKPMASWYTMDPLYAQFERLFGDQAAARYHRFNTMVGMASPGSEVLVEINRGTAAHWLAQQGRFQDFIDYAGIKAEDRAGTKGFPADMFDVDGHSYHSTAHYPGMQKFLNSGRIMSKEAKVPTYVLASGVPQLGFQTRWPVGDAHWSRLMGLADVRGGGPANWPGAASTTEMYSLSPWFRNIARQFGLEAVPAQAIVWGAGSRGTGITSPIGAGKLELLAIRIGEAAKRLGISPEAARDMVLRGQTHASILGGGLALGGAAGNYFASGHPLDSPEPEAAEEMQ